MNDSEPLSLPAKKLLMEPVFRPSRSKAVLAAEWVEEVLRCDERDARLYLEELATHGLLLPYHGPEAARLTPPCFQPSPDASLTSERLVRQHKKRREPLINQASYRLKDLILAICFEDHASNRRLTGGFGAATIFPVVDLYFFLAAPKESVDEAIEELTSSRLLEPNVQRVGNEDVRYVYLTRKGVRYYEDQVRQKFGLGPADSILDEPAQSLAVFFAWQSENKPARNKLSTAVPRVVERINSENKLLRELTLVQATEAGAGALRIDVAIEERIKNATYFVGDLTPVYAYHGRLRVNENVLVETGFALASKPPSRIVLLEMRDPEVRKQSPNPVVRGEAAGATTAGWKNLK
jgi:hypothetical protein